MKHGVCNSLITTYQIIKEKILPKYKNVYHINYPKEYGYMSDQLNYMLDIIKTSNILKEKVDFENTFLALYNADSRPSENTFNEIYKNIENNVDVIQQYSYNMLNYKSLSILLKGFSIYQSAFELREGFLNSYLNFNYLYSYVVGHGLIIKLSLLDNLNGFNTKYWCEDMYLTMQLKFRNIKIVPLLSLENIETPNRFTKLIRQNSVWFNTTSKFFNIYKDIMKTEKRFSFSGLIGCINEFRCYLNWLLFPIFIVLIIIVPILYNKYIISIISFILFTFYIIINTLITFMIIEKLEGIKYKINIKTLIGVSCAYLLSNLGPLYSIFNNSDKKYKTER